MPPSHLALRKAVVAAARAMNGLGINQGSSGNVSVRAGKGFLITPTALPYDRTGPEDIVAMALDGSHRGNRRPSSEWRFHRDIYAARPDAGAVVHTHAVHATALACLRKPIDRGPAPAPAAPLAPHGVVVLRHAAIERDKPGLRSAKIRRRAGRVSSNTRSGAACRGRRGRRSIQPASPLDGRSLLPAIRGATLEDRPVISPRSIPTASPRRPARRWRGSSCAGAPWR